jgi:hypothetical protein
MYLLLRKCFFHPQESDAAVKHAEQTSGSEAEALSFTPADIACVASHVSAQSAVPFCDFVWNVALYAEGCGCDAIVASGVIPLLFAIIARHVNAKDVVPTGCGALFRLVENGNESVKRALREVCDCESILRAAQVSGFDLNGDAVHVLKKLGL